MIATLRQFVLLFAGAMVGSAGEVPAQFPLQGVGGAQVAIWQTRPNPSKPYIAQLFAPGEKPLALLEDSPPDHFHHHGLMFALRVDGTDFWKEKGIKNAGREEPVETKAEEDKSGYVRLLRWTATDGTPLLAETRRVGVRVSGEGVDAVHWLDWQSVLTPAAGRDAVRLSGDHYFGLGMRLAPAWKEKGGFMWQDTTGQKVVRGDEKLTPGGWCAVHCVIDGRAVTVLMLGHPGNARPVRWFTMSKPFCYLSATTGLDEKPEQLLAGDHWALRYGVAVMAGNPDRSRLEKLAADWQTFSSESKTQPNSRTKP